MRTFFKIFLVIVVLLVVFLFWAIDGVDYTPYVKTPFYKSAKQRLDSLRQHTRPVSGAVMVGFGKQGITPRLNAKADDASIGAFAKMPLAGYGGRKGAPATGIHDSLFVKAVALQIHGKTMIFIGSDLLIVPPEVSAQCGQMISELGIARDQVFYSATHSHSSVGAWSAGTVGELFGGEYNPEVVKWLAKRFAAAIKMAIDDLQPGQLGIGSFKAPAFVRNRLIGDDGKIDSDFMLIKASQIHGKKGIIGAFDAHATTLGEWNMETSADYPGYWQRRLEHNGFDMAVFLAGSVGSHSYRSKGERFEKTKYIGEALADSVVKYSSSIVMKDSISLASMTLQIDIPEFQIRISDGLRLNPTLAGKLFPDVGSVYLQVMRMDSLIWATAPSDFSGETAIVYKNAMHQKGMKAMVTSFNGAYTGYIIPCRYYHLDGYEPRTMNWFGPAYNPFVNDMLYKMMEIISSE